VEQRDAGRLVEAPPRDRAGESSAVTKQPAAPPPGPRLYVRCWLPDDAGVDCAPWALCHPDEAALSDEQLGRRARQFADSGGLDGYLDPDAFQSWLEAEHGYLGLQATAHAGVFMVEVGGWAEREDELGPDEFRPLWPGLSGPSAAGLDRAIATAWAVRQAATATLIRWTLQRIARQVAAATPGATRLHFCVRYADEPGHLDGLGVARLTDAAGAEVRPLDAGVGGLEELLLEDLAALAGVADIDPDTQVLDLACRPPALAVPDRAARPVD
jgi:hypothetical protein